MRQYGGAAAICLHSLPPDVTFKEVVVIGNGPSGISTSHLLAGHWPYLAAERQWSRSPALDPMLLARLASLASLGAAKSLMLQDLPQLADGLEGRSVNPLPLLMDNLLYPCADVGLDIAPMLEWKYYPERQIEHVVLGRGKAGGAWHCFDARVLTLSPARWLRLAGGDVSVASSSGAPLARARVADVASYYESYVAEMGLQRFFRNNTFVTSVRPVRCFSHSIDCPGSNCPTKALWCVSGYDSNQHSTFRYLCTRVVLATGASDRPNTLEAAPAGNAVADRSDEGSSIYSLPTLELEIDRLIAEAQGPLEDIPPVLVVGSGLSAADAVVAARSGGLKTAHAYRCTQHAPPLASLPSAVYPDYHAVYQMMRDGPSGSHELYTALPDQILVQISECPDEPDLAASIKPKIVRLLDAKTNEISELKVSICAILIGSKPDLSFLPENFDDRYVSLAFEGNALRMTDNAYSFNRKTERSRCAARHSFLKTQWHNLKTIVGYKLRRSKELKIVDGDESGECGCAAEPKARAEPKSDSHCDGLGLGLDVSKPIDCRSNPVDIDKNTHEVRNSPKGLYALGPLTGDNFVRFIPGGALAVVSNIWSERKDDLYETI